MNVLVVAYGPWHALPVSTIITIIAIFITDIDIIPVLTTACKAVPLLSSSCQRPKALSYRLHVLLKFRVLLEQTENNPYSIYFLVTLKVDYRSSCISTAAQ